MPTPTPTPSPEPEGTTPWLHEGYDVWPYDLPHEFCYAWYIDSTDGQKQAFRLAGAEAVRTWNDALGLVVFTITGDCPERNLDGDVYDGSHDYLDRLVLGGALRYRDTGTTLTNVGLEMVVVTLNIRYLATHQCNVATLIHELGHTLWLGHSEHTSSIMFRKPVSSTCHVRSIQPWEVRQIREALGVE